jgi:hypothetical protein
MSEDFGESVVTVSRPRLEPVAVDLLYGNIESMTHEY